MRDRRGQFTQHRNARGMGKFRLNLRQHRLRLDPVVDVDHAGETQRLMAQSLRKVGYVQDVQDTVVQSADFHL